MNCIKHIKATSIPHDMLIKMTDLYQQMGMNDYYEDMFAKKLDFYKHKTAEENAKAFYQMFLDDFKPIASSRMHSLTLESSSANNRSEQLFKNILGVFRKIHYASYEGFELQVAEIRELVHYMFQDVIDIPKYRTLTKKKSLFNSKSYSLREQFETYLHDVEHLVKSKEIEPIFLYTNVLVDFINMKVFDFKYNDLVGTLMYYILLIESGLSVSYLVSFFPKLLLDKDRYFKLLKESSFQWEEGLSDVMPLTKYMIKIYQRMYDDVKDMSRDIQFEQETPILKTDFIENIILKMPETFSKQDIRKKHPHVSDSTINRTLKRLQDEDKIRSLGKGRSAKWVKIIHSHEDQEQLKFNLDDE